ncbi:anthranilate synthase component 1 [Arthrobacter sp. Hiyo6]|nr:anthranilate synthase component 1 [Arthrobacter sp. Hiyo6]
MQDLGIISPGLEEFRELAGHSRVIPVRLKVLADAETPIGLYRKLAQGQPGTFLMESAAVGGSWSRYSFIGAKSRATLTTKDGQAYWQGEPPAGVPVSGNPVEAIRDTIERCAPSVLTACRPSPPDWWDSWAGRLSATGRSSPARPRMTWNSRKWR